MQVLLFEKLQELGESRDNAWLVAQKMCYPPEDSPMSLGLHQRITLEFNTGLKGPQIDALLDEVKS